MNYIHRLQSELTTAQESLKRVEAELLEFRRYLQSDKFSVQTYIERDDALRRLDAVWAAF